MCSHMLHTSNTSKAATAPAKAASITTSMPVSARLDVRATPPPIHSMTKATPRLAPECTPKIEGSAKALPKNV